MSIKLRGTVDRAKLPKDVREKIQILPDEYFVEIGKITVYFAYLEEMMGIAIGLLADDLHLGAVLHAKISLRNLLDVFDSMCRAKINDKALHIRSQTLITQIARCEDKRNKIVHSQWSWSSKNRKANRRKSKIKRNKGLERIEESSDLSQLLSLSDEIADLTASVIYFMGDAYSSIHNQGRLGSQSKSDSKKISN